MLDLVGRVHVAEAVTPLLLGKDVPLAPLDYTVAHAAVGAGPSRELKVERQVSVPRKSIPSSRTPNTYGEACPTDSCSSHILVR